MSYAHQKLWRFSAPLAALLLTPFSEAMAQPAGSGTQASGPVAKSPFVGEWELDLTRMPSTYGPLPKRVTYTFEDVGSGKLRTTVEIHDSDGGVRRGTTEYRLDGQAVPAEGTTGEADHVAVNAPAPNVMVLCLARNKGLVSVRTYAVSQNGLEMTESAADVDDAGAPFVRNFHYKRVR